MQDESFRNLPRNMALKTFDPHRSTFECRHEADHVPAIDPEAETWFQEGLLVTSRELWPNQRNYPRAVELWAKAAERRHWKAMMNLASVLIEGDGVEPYVVPANPERAIRVLEEGMRLGIPAAFDAMGTYHPGGLGVNADASRAFAFWELAADMGSPRAQSFLGEKLNAAYDSPGQGWWGNKKVGLKMIECAFAQGYAPAAFDLGGEYEVVVEDNSKAIAYYQAGVKMGSEDCARSLFVIFADGKTGASAITADRPRAERYRVLKEALWHNPDLRFPNLDKVLPLPPAPLPQWDGKNQSLIDAAKAVIPRPAAPPPPSFPASTRTGRAHIPEGWTLPETPQGDIRLAHENTNAPVAGYWLMQLRSPWLDRHRAWNAEQVPQRYDRGETFDRSRAGLLDEDGRVEFRFLGQAVAQPATEPPEADVRVRRGVARAVDAPELFECRGHETCPRTGIWSASVANEHPLAPTFNQWFRQSYVDKGERFPDPRHQHLDIASRDVKWRWLNSSNEVYAPGLARIRLDES